MDWHFRQDDKICSFRASGVFINDGKVLVQRDGREYALPTVRVRVGETAEQSLVREFREATGLRMTCSRMLWVDESLWSCRGKDYHSIVFYFLVESEGDFPFEKFSSQSESGSLLLEWADIDSVKSMNIYPEFIKTKIADISDGIEHFINKE